MRFLKRKMTRKSQSLNDKEANESQILSEIKIETKVEGKYITDCCPTNPSLIFHKEVPLKRRKSRLKPTNPDQDSKNIVKNYGKALVSFACSLIAVPYLEHMIRKENLSFIQTSDFIEFLSLKKEEVNNIASLRNLLLEDENEIVLVSTYKKIFKKLSIIFIKYFSVNWIFSGRLKHKKAHLNMRFKMLRRIQDPKNFTYLKNTKTR